MRRALLPLLVLTLVAAGCGGSDDDDGRGAAVVTSTTLAPTTTTPPTDLAPYVEPGPYAAGTTSFALDDGRRVVAWYPADAAAVEGQPKLTFDIASLLSPELQAQVPAEARPQYEIDAYPGAAPATDDGPYPVVLFSHGFGGFPEQSADLVTHLASWGFVVVTPNHVERSLDGLLGTAARGVAPRKDPEVLAATLDATVAQAGTDTSPLSGLVDAEHVAATGHSAGAAAAYLFAAADDRVDAFVSYSVGFRGEDGETSAAAPEAPAVPGMVMLAEQDTIIEPAVSEKVYESMRAPKALVRIAQSGHQVFSDLCLIGREQGGLPGIVEQIGLPIPDRLLRLVYDGCSEDQLDPADAFGAVDGLSVDFLRWALGVDDALVGLDDPAVVDGFEPAQVSVESDLEGS